MKSVKKLISLFLAIFMLGSTAAFADDTSDEEVISSALVVVYESENQQPLDSATEFSAGELDVVASTDEDVELAIVDSNIEQESDQSIEMSTDVINDDQQSVDNIVSTSSAVVDTKAENQTESEQASEVNSTSNRNVIIDNCKVAKMENTDYQYMKFSFHDSDDGTQYTAYIGGITFSKKDDFTTDHIIALCTDVANSFYDGKVFVLCDTVEFCSKYQINFDVIDTEKVHPTATTEHGTDQELCWAGSASDMLTYSGWGSAAGTNYNNENKLFDYFESSYTDMGSSQNTGIKWFFSGVNTAQYTYTSTGEVVNGYTQGSTAQEKWKSTEENPFAEKNGATLTSYVEEKVEDFYQVVSDGYDPLYEAALKLEEGQALGLGIFFYNGGTRGGGHAITALGYIKETLREGMDAIKSFFIADTDNDINTASTREQTINSVTMYSVTKGTIPNGTGTLDTYELGNYSSSVSSPILDYTTLQPYATTKDIAADTTESSKDIINNVDYTVIYNKVVDSNNAEVTEAEVGQDVYFTGTISNTSYKVLDVSTNPMFTVSYTISCDGVVVDTFTGSIYLDATTETAQAPNKYNTFLISKPYHLNKAGDYTVSYEIGELFYIDENDEIVIIPEAYTTNNYSRKDYKFTVKDSGSGDTPAIDPSQGGATSIPTYTATYTTTKSQNTKGLVVNINSVGDQDIYLSQNGQILTSNDYTLIFNGDGTITVIFTRAFIKSLAPGNHQFNIVDSNGKILTVIDVSIR